MNASLSLQHFLAFIACDKCAEQSLWERTRCNNRMRTRATAREWKTRSWRSLNLTAVVGARTTHWHTETVTPTAMLVITARSCVREQRLLMLDACRWRCCCALLLLLLLLVLLLLLLLLLLLRTHTGTWRAGASASIHTSLPFDCCSPAGRCRRRLLSAAAFCSQLARRSLLFRIYS